MKQEVFLEADSSEREKLFVLADVKQYVETYGSYSFWKELEIHFPDTCERLRKAQKLCALLEKRC